MKYKYESFKKHNSDKGITLISLIITVIILIILLGLIELIVPDGIFKKAEDSAKKTESVIADGQDEIDKIKNDYIEVPSEREDGTENVLPELEVNITNITRVSLKITANATDADGDTLNYTLTINGKTYGPSETNNWDITGLTPGKVYEYKVEVTDGYNTVKKTGSIKTIVNQKPEVTVAASNVTTTSATITANATDGDNDPLQYTLTINGKTYGPSTTTNSWNITGLTETTTYPYTVTVNDGYDTVTKTGNLTTGSSNSAPTIVTNSAGTRTTTSIDINAQATDADGDNLTYELYTSTAQNGTYTKKATSSTVAQNSQVTLSSTGLANYTTYWWYIVVNDGKTTTTSGKQSVRTYCPGTGLICWSLYCNGKTCSTCGRGQVETLQWLF